MSYSDDYQSARENLRQGNTTAALDVLQRLAEVRYVEALNLLGWVYLAGDGVQQDIERAKLYLAMAESEGSAEGTFYHGRAHAMQGNVQNALQCYRLAAGKHYSPALFRLGLAYRSGRGVAADLTKAERYLSLAADQEHRMAMRELALMEIRGQFGLPRAAVGLWRLGKFIALTIVDLVTLRQSTEHVT